MRDVTLARGTALARSPADWIIRLAGVLTTAYLAVTLLPMVHYARAANDPAPSLAHLTALLFASIVVVVRRGSTIRFLRDWMPLLVGPFLYVELRWLIEGMGRAHMDGVVQLWEAAMFPGNPSATWATSASVPALSEALHLAYASYYLLVYVPPALLYFRGRRSAFAETVFALTLVYGLCFAAYLFFPVDGPRYLLGAAPAPEGPIRSFVLRLLDAGSSRGTAFPSSHVAASVVASLGALREQRTVGIVVAALTVGLALGAVYGGFHYAVDVLAGLLVGLVSWVVAVALWRAASTPGAQSATAA